MTVSCVVAPDQRQARLVARREMVQQVEHGMTVREARECCAVPMHRTTVYRLLKRVQHKGEQAYTDQRHGHPTKLREDVLTWVLNYCQSHASASSAEVQRRLIERFGLSVSVSQLNRVRAAHGLSRKAIPQEKKSRKRASPFPRDRMPRRVACSCWQPRPKPGC
jgi:transposase